MLYEVIPTKIFRSGASFLTYSSDEKLLPGHVVLIPLGRSSCVGIVKSISHATPAFKVKPITRLLYPTPLPPHLLKSLLWLSEYYLLPLPAVASLFLPIGVEKSRRKPSTPASLSNPECCNFYNTNREKNPQNPENPSQSPKIPLNPAQLSALSALENAPSATRLLHGITGSGKTNIYLELTRQTLERGQSVILLVPEIALTSQLVSIFESTFGHKIVLIHSRLTESARHQIWASLLTASEPVVVLGPRSALFSPLANLGLIIIDEAHESAYYQENSPRYSALRLASFIAKTKKIPCILGTATPLVADYYLAKKSSSYIPLTVKAKPTATPPSISLIDLKNRDNFTKNRYFSDALLTKIKENLENGRQTLIFHNRRGSAPLTLCEHCGYEALCPNCFLPLTLHSDSFSLVCHVCGHSLRVPASCPDCGTPGLLHKGFGTKLLESELKKLFPSATLARFDADNKKSETLDALYGDVRSGAINILIGTQTLAKGLDLPHLATVGVVRADAGLALPDFAAEEKTFHLLTQVIGRVGRGHLSDTSVIIQTFQPDHPVLRFAIKNDYSSFADYLLRLRKKQSFPPYFFLARLTISAKTESTAVRKIREAARLISAHPAATNLSLSPPTPVFHERSAAGFSWQLLLKSPSRSVLLSVLRDLPPRLSAHLTLDPPSLL